MTRRFPAIPGGKAKVGGLLSLKPARRIHRGAPCESTPKLKLEREWEVRVRSVERFIPYLVQGV